MKRYSSYKDSGVDGGNLCWIGEIPEHWIVKKLKFFAKILNGKDYQENEVEEGGYPVYGSGGQFALSSKYLYDKPSVLLGRKGTVDKPQIVFTPFWTSDTTYYTEVFEDVEPKFLFHLVKQIRFDLYIYGSAIPSMTKTVYNDMQFCYPPLPEQQAIVTYLDEKTTLIDDLIKKKQEKIQLLKENRTALINHVVTKGLDPEIEMKDSGEDGGNPCWIGEVPQEWIVSRLKFVASIRSGFALNSSVKSENALSYPYLRVANVQDGYLNLSTVTEVEMNSESASRYFLQYGDLLMNEGGDNDKLGRGCVWREEITPCLHQNHVFAVRMNHAINSEWINLITLTSYAKSYFQLNCKQSTNLASISQSSIKELPVLLPPSSEQESIIQYLDEQTQLIDQTIQQEEQKIELLKEYRQSLISEVVTGKICVV